MKKSSLLYILIFALIPAFMACNEKDKNEDTDEEIVYLSAANTAVTSFSLRSDTLCPNIENVFFTIDLVGKRIFNADSLPVGTDIRRLRLNIGYPTEVKEVTIRMRDSEYRKKDLDVNYLDYQYDTIDFTGKVTLKIVAANEKDSSIYDLKVNVHQMKPDSMFWDKLAVKPLPSQNTPVEQKTLSHNGKVYSLIKTAAGYQVSSIDNPAESNWTETPVQFGFTPRINTFIATSDAFYILSDAGKLFTSADALSWAAAPGSTQSYYNLYGGYGDKVLGSVRKSENDFFRAFIYSPAEGDKDIDQLPVRMPVEGFSPFVTFDSEVALAPQVMLVGGADMFGDYTTACWGFDGDNWAQISASELPGLYGAMLFPYKIFKVASNWVTTEFNVLMAIGGKDENDKANKRVFYSYDNGVYWVEGSELMQMPDYFPAVIGAQAIVADIQYTRAASDDGWNLMPSVKLPVWFTPMPATRADYTITWECPYIYVFGGTDLSGNLNNSVWRGVLNRLSFKPLI